MKKFRIFFISAIVLQTLVGCGGGGTPPPPVSNESVVENAQETDKTYVLQEGDILDIKFFYNPDLNETITIRPDGRISLQLIDEIDAAGLVPMELDKLVTEKYSKVILGPEITVIVREFAGQRVYVGGEVLSPGLVVLTGKQTVLQAIFEAGGFKNSAAKNSVVLLRNQGTEDPVFKTLNLGEDLGAGDTPGDMFLKPYDVVYVPKTTIAKMNQFVDSYINKLIPISFVMGFDWIYYLNPPIQVQP